MFDRYSEGARRALFFTRYELSHLGGAIIEPGHLLLGLLRGSKGIQRLFAHLSIPLGELRLTIEHRVTRGDKLPTSAEVPFASATKRVLNFAAEEADRLLHHDIEAEHLLLGLLRENDPVAAASLSAYGISLNGTREFIASPPHTDNAAIDTQLVESVKPLAAAHVERIMQLVRDLAQAESGSPEGRMLVGRIDQELMMLMELLRCA
jgi:ATP-dependent Clp protease ATP-binding subunit ClpA